MITFLLVIIVEADQRPQISYSMGLMGEGLWEAQGGEGEVREEEVTECH